MFDVDKPIDFISEDKLGRSNSAKMMAHSLLNLYNEEAFTIGLYGKWGSGKTSLTNMILNEIKTQQTKLNEEEKFIFLRFDPWNFSDADHLLEQFLKSLTSIFSTEKNEKLNKIGESLKKYSNAFELARAIPIVGDTVASVGKGVATSVGEQMQNKIDEGDIQGQKANVVKQLDEIKQKILIVIDDIDRLSNEQISLVFQLIASVANFPHIIYLVVFDKEIVVKALEEIQKGSGEDYLEKIIQLPIQLPDIQHDKLRTILFEKMEDILHEYPGISFKQDYWQDVFQVCIDPFINNVRDVNRLCNLIRFKISDIFSEINFVDMVALSTLEITFPSVYTWVKENKSILTGERDISLNNNKTTEDFKEEYSKQIISLLHDSYDKENDLNAILKFLSKLFPYFGRKIGLSFDPYNRKEYRKNNRIAHSDKFDRYFSLDIESVDIKKDDVLKAANQFNIKEFSLCLIDYDNKGLSYEFLEELSAIISDLSTDRIKVIIQSLLYTATSLNGFNSKNIFTLQSSALAYDVLTDLFDIFPIPERLQLFISYINISNEFSLPSIAHIINMVELAYGRLSANGEERNYKKIFTLNELDEIEKIFSKKAEQLLEEYDLFDLSDWNIVCYLMEYFEAEYINKYLKISFNNDIHVAIYLESSVSVWYGSSIDYEIKENYLKHVTKERVIQAIESLRDSEEFFELADTNQAVCCAFYIYYLENHDQNEHISQKEVEDLLVKWRNIAS